MTCPYCDKEMQKGTISGIRTGGLQWLPEEKSSDVWEKLDRAMGVTGRIEAARYNFAGFQIDAHYCKDCQKLIVDTAISQ